MVWSIYTNAQINESDTSAFQVNTGLTGIYQQGNVSILSLRGKLVFSSRIGKDVVIKSQNSSLYQAFFGNKADADFSSRNFVYFQPQQNFYPVGLVFISSNFRRKVQARYLMGIGETWNAINNSHHSWKLTLSTFYESSRFTSDIFNDDSFNGKNNLEFWRWAIYTAGNHLLLGNRIQLNYHAFIEPAFYDFKNYRAEVEIGLNFSIQKGFSFRINYLYLFEYLVVNGIKQNDEILTFGLGYKFKAK